MRLIGWLVGSLFGWFLGKWGFSKVGQEVENNLKLKRVLYCLLIEADKRSVKVWVKSDEEP